MHAGVKRGGCDGREVRREEGDVAMKTIGRCHEGYRVLLLRLATKRGGLLVLQRQCM